MMHVKSLPLGYPHRYSQRSITAVQVYCIHADRRPHHGQLSWQSHNLFTLLLGTFPFVVRPPWLSLHRPAEIRILGCGHLSGGVDFYHRNSLSTKKTYLPQVTSTFEALAKSISLKRGPVALLPICRPGSSSPSSAFFSELSTLLEQFAVNDPQLVLTGI